MKPQNKYNDCQTSFFTIKKIFTLKYLILSKLHYKSLLCFQPILCIKEEVVAGRPRPCGKTEFTCSNRRCIPIQLQCDLFNDCGNGGLDEQDCKACKCNAVNLSRQIKEASRRDEKYSMSLQCYQEAQKSPHFRYDVLLFMVIYV